MMDGQIVIVCGEEDIMISHLSTFKYVEVDGEIHETLCQGFEKVKIEEEAPLAAVQPAVINQQEISMSLYKDAKAIVESGVNQKWGKVIEPVKMRKNHGIGYVALEGKDEEEEEPPKVRGPFCFTSAGMFFDRVNAVSEDGGSDCDMDSWIRPCPSGLGLDNWTAEKIVQVTKFE